MAKDPTAVSQKWAAGMQNAGQAIADGVGAVTQAPGQAAAAQKAVYLQNVQANADKWARNVANVSLAEWKDAMINKGAQRIGQGAVAAQPKFQQFMAKLLPFIESGVKTLPPRGTFQQNLARANAWATYMHTFQK